MNRIARIAMRTGSRWMLIGGKCWDNGEQLADFADQVAKCWSLTSIVHDTIHFLPLARNSPDFETAIAAHAERLTIDNPEYLLRPDVLDKLHGLTKYGQLYAMYELFSYIQYEAGDDSTELTTKIDDDFLGTIATQLFKHACSPGDFPPRNPFTGELWAWEQAMQKADLEHFIQTTKRRRKPGGEEEFA